MTVLKIKGLASRAADAVEPHIRNLYDNDRARLIFVGELEHVARTMPGPASDAAPQVAARISHLEVPSGINQDLIRMVLRSLYLLRTGRGTLDEASGQLNLATESARIADSIGVLFASEATEARAVLHVLCDQLDALASITDETKRRRRVGKLVAAARSFLATGDRETLAVLAQDQFDLSGTGVEGTPVEVDVTTDDERIGAETLESIGSTEPVTVGQVIEGVAEQLSAAKDKPPARKRAARKQAEPATTGAGA